MKITKGCQTVDGEDCIFPFIWRKITYNECTIAGTGWGAAVEKNHFYGPWCAISVNENGYVVRGGWGKCKNYIHTKACFNGDEKAENDRKG